jgi:hypothetical protein
MTKKMKATLQSREEPHILSHDLGYQTDDEKILDMLMRYCSNSSDTSLTKEEMAKIRHILSTDRRWKKIFEELHNDYQRMVGSIGTSAVPQILISLPRRSLFDLFRAKIERLLPALSVRIAIGTLVIVALIYGATAVTSSIVTPVTVPLAKLERESLVVRGEQNIPVEAVNAIQSGRYSEAIDRLRALSLTRLDSTIQASVDYLLGIALLHSAESSFGGPLNLFPHYNRAPVLDGIRYLQSALRKSRSDDRRRDFQDACRFALGKASLMLGDIRKAEVYFLQVNERNNPYRMPSRIILSSLSR